VIGFLQFSDNSSLRFYPKTLVQYEKLKKKNRKNQRSQYYFIKRNPKRAIGEGNVFVISETPNSWVA